MREQSALGGREVNRKPKYDHLRIARVTSVKDFHKYGRIEAVFLDYSQPQPVWCFGSVDREPVEGDAVLIGFIEGRKDAPYLHSFMKNDSYCTNFVMVGRDAIKLQLPIFEIGVRDGISHRDVQGHLLDDTKQGERAYIELTPDHAIVSFPTSEDGSTAPATITVTRTGVVIDHPAGTVKHHGGGKGVARIGDAISVVVDGITYTGTIISGSEKTLVD